MQYSALSDPMYQVVVMGMIVRQGGRAPSISAAYALGNELCYRTEHKRDDAKQIKTTRKTGGLRMP